MAKSPNKSITNPATVNISVPANFTIEAHGHKLTTSDLETMSPKALAYLLANGYKQSLTDAAAFTKDQKAGKSAVELADMANTRRASRHEAILNGSVGAVSGSRATPIERFMEQVAEERVRAIATARGVPMPKNTKEAKTLDAAIAKIIEKYGPDVRAEAEARMSAAQAAALDAGDILG